MPVLAICTKRSCDIIFMKMKVIWFCLQKAISGSYLKQNNSFLVFQTHTIFLKWVHSWSYDQNVIFKTMNYFFLNRNFALKLQGNCWKDDVVTFSAHLRVTIKRLVLAAMLEGKSMPSNMAANTNRTTLKSYYFILLYFKSYYYYFHTTTCLFRSET